MPQIALSIVIPVYNSQGILPVLLARMNEALPRFLPVGAYEVILVEDCGPDNSWQVICEACQRYEWLRGIRLRKNVGQHGAMMAGLRQTRGKVVVTMDDDLQHAPEDIERLYRTILEGRDLCYAEFGSKQHAAWKVLGSRFNNWTAEKLIDKPQGLHISSFKAIAGEVVREIIKYEGPYVYVDGLLFMVTRNAVNITVQHHERFEGKGNYGFFSSLFLWTKMATNFSVMPLRIASFMGFGFAASGLLFALYLIWVRFQAGAPEVPGWYALIVVVLVLGGIQMVALGTIGEYLGRSYVSINRKPQFTVKEQCGFDTEPQVER